MGDGPQLMVLSSAATIILLFLRKPEKTFDKHSSNASKSLLKLYSQAFTHPQARLRIFHPHRSCTALGYMVDSRDVFVTPQKNSPPEDMSSIVNHQLTNRVMFFLNDKAHTYPFHSKRRNIGSHRIFGLLHGQGSQKA